MAGFRTEVRIWYWHWGRKRGGAELSKHGGAPGSPVWETEKPEAGHAHHHLMEMGHQLQLFFFWFKYYLKQEEGKRGRKGGGRGGRREEGEEEEVRRRGRGREG